MKSSKNHFSFLAIGETRESTDAPEGFKRYIGYSNSYVLAVNPTKGELEKIYGHEVSEEPKYVGDDGQIYIHFIVKTDPNDGEDKKRNIPGHGIEIINKFMITLRPTQAVNQDGTQVTVIDKYGNYARMLKADAEAHNKPVSVNGKDLRVDTDYKIAFEGQDILTHFLKTYLGMGCGFDYKNGVWVKKEESEADLDKFVFEKPGALLKGDMSEVREAINIRPNNKIKLLYGVKTSEDGKQYQQICTRDKFILRSNAGSDQIAKMDGDLQDAYNRGSFSNVEYKVQKLQEYTVTPTNLDKPAESSSGDDMPW